MTKSKSELVRKKEELSIKPVIKPTDLVPLINKAWKASFAQVEHNKRAISERGWNPFNRNLLTYKDIRGTMTEKECEQEQQPNSEIFLPQKTADVNDPSPSYDDAYILQAKSDIRLNFENGTGKFCLNAIAQQDQLSTARNLIALKQTEGKTFKERLLDTGKLTSATLFLNRENKIGRDCFSFLAVKKEEKEKAKKEVVRKARNDYMSIKREAEPYLLLIKGGTSPSKLKNKELNTVLKSLKRDPKADGAIPTVKKEMLAKYEEWKDRLPPIFERFPDDPGTIVSLRKDEADAIVNPVKA